MARSLESVSAHRWLSWLILAVAALLLASCQSAPPPSGPPAPGAAKTQIGPPQSTMPQGTGEMITPSPTPGQPMVRVALLLPLSAANSDIKAVAAALLNSAQLAVFEGGNPDLLLLPKDTGGTAAGAQAAAHAAVNDGAQLILGPLLREEVQAVAPIARDRHIPVLAFSTDRDVAGDGVFLLSFQPEQEIARVTAYALSQGRYTFAALIPDTDYGARVRDAYIATVQNHGGRVVAIQDYTPSPAAMADPVKSLANYERRSARDEVPAPASSDMALPSYGAATDSAGLPVTDLDRMRQYQTFGYAPFDTILLPEGGTLLRALAPLLPYFDVDPRSVKFIGTGLWDDPILSREPALQGGWFAAPPPETRKAFLSRYEQAYGATPPRIASLSFDAVALASALARLPKDQRFSLATLTNPNGFSGIDGIFRFLPDGSSERGLAVLQVSSSGFKVVDPAPSTFETPVSF